MMNYLLVNDILLVSRRQCLMANYKNKWDCVLYMHTSKWKMTRSGSPSVNIKKFASDSQAFVLVFQAEFSSVRA